MTISGSVKFSQVMDPFFNTEKEIREYSPLRKAWAPFVPTPSE